jgi:hypothetical protein
MVRPAEFEYLLDNLPLLIHLDGVHAHVLAVVFVLRDRVLERLVNILEAVLQDVAEAEERGQADAAKLQIVHELLQIDRPVRVLGRVNPDVAAVGDREVSLSPPGNFVELGRVAGGPCVADVVRGPHAADWLVHMHNIICVTRRRFP